MSGDIILFFFFGFHCIHVRTQKFSFSYKQKTEENWQKKTFQLLEESVDECSATDSSTL